MTSSHLTRHLGFFYFPKKSRNNGNLFKTKPENASAEFLQFGETGKNYRIMSRKLFLSHIKFAVAIAMSKRTDTQLTYQNFRRRWTKSYWKFQRLKVNRLLKNLETPYEGMAEPTLHPPPQKKIHLARPRIKFFLCKLFVAIAHENQLSKIADLVCSH